MIQETIKAAADRLTAIRFSSPVKIEAAKAGKLPTFTINAYNGGPMNVTGFFYPVVADSAGGRVAAESIPVLRDHDASRIVGKSTSVEIAKPSGVINVAGVVTGTDADAMGVVDHAKNGFEWQASIGATVERREFVDAGKSVSVNGRSVSGPVIIAREWTLYETSFVALGADPSTSAAVRAASKGKRKVEFETFVSSKGFDPSNLSDQQRSYFEAAFEAERSGGVATDVQASRQRAADEVERIGKIDALFAQSGLDYGLNDRGDRIDNLRATAIRTGMEPRDVELMVVRAERAAVAPSGHTRVIGAGANQTDILAAQVVVESIGQSKAATVVEPQVMEAARRVPWAGIIGLISACLRMEGRAIPSDKLDAIKAGFSTYSLPNALGNAANKIAEAVYKETPLTFLSFAARRETKDFKDNTSIRPIILGEMSELGPTGMIEHGTLDESTITYRSKSFAKMFGVPFAHLVNDDTKIFSEIIPGLVRMASRGISTEVWSGILNSGTFFHADNGNLLTGAGSALSVEALADAITAMRKQEDENGSPLDIMPAVLAVPPELEPTAKQVLNSMELNRTGDSSPTGNPVAKSVKLEVEPRISASGITGSSATQWFLFGSPADMPVVVATLEGRPSPSVESEPAPFNQLGQQWRVVYHYGFATGDHRAAVRSAGA